jgi:transcriptional regulator with XRE-family HTH domain
MSKSDRPGGLGAGTGGETEEGATERPEAERLGERIRRLREHKRWGPQVLAEQAGVSRQYVWQVERGKMEAARPRKLDAIARALGWPDAETMAASEELEPPFTAVKEAEPPAAAEVKAGGEGGEQERLGREARAFMQELVAKGIQALPVVTGPSQEFRKVYLEAEISAGPGSGARLERTAEYVWMHEDEVRGRDLFLARVRGSCMEPKLYAGDTVLCERVRYVDQVPTGTLCVVTLLEEAADDESGGNVKYVHWGSEKVRLTAEDNFSRAVGRDRIKVEGRVIEMRRRL